MQKTEIPAAEHILVCLSSSPSNERIVRTAGRMASVFGGSFTALYVQTPENTAMREDDQLRLQENTRLAQQLGAEIVTMRGEDVPTQIAEYARLSGVTRIVIGRSGAQRRSFWSSPTLTERLIELAPRLDIHIIPDVDVYKNYHQKKPTLMRPAVPTLRELLLTLGILTAATAIGWLFLRLGFTDANIITLYLLGVLFTSVLTSGYTCGILASILSVILFNYFLTEPHLSLLAYGSGYPVTFVIMLGASILTGTLATKLKAHAQLSAHDAFRTKLLFDTNQQLQKAQSEEDAYQTTAVQLQRLLERDILVYPAENGQPGIGLFYAADGSPACSVPPAQRESEVVEWTWQNRKRAGATTAQFPKAKYLYLAIRTQQQAYGVIGISVAGKPLDAFESSITLSILGECALALDNLRNAKEKEEAAVLAKNEQLRANLLRSISHDLRTPLTSISGNADTLLHSDETLDAAARTQIFSDIFDDAQWLNGLVENLLSITKIAEGSVRLHLSDQIVEDVITEALRHIDRRSKEHSITVDCGDAPVLARMDAGLIVQVLVNLVNNAIKYTPAGSHIQISARAQGRDAVICVTDDGPGIPPEWQARAFELFFTAGKPAGDSSRSLGLGLPLCRSIVEAHGGALTLADNAPHGCVFTFTLPISEVTLHE